MSTTPPPSYSTDPYGTPYGNPSNPANPGDRPRRRGTLAAAVIATSLFVGGGAGLGGAALWGQTHDEGSSTSSVVQTRTSTVASTKDAPAPAAAASGSVEDVAARVLPSVVKINVAGAQGAGSGSGIILTADGTILTNNHVVEVAGDNGTISVDFADGTSADATVLGTDPLTDTAVIKAKGVTGLTAATIGRSGTLAVGEGVVAIGSPFGLDATVTSGIVSALNRPVNVGTDSENNATTYPAIQTDAAINPGNSGGPLVDMAGAVVGINSSIRTASQSGPGQDAAGSIGLGFAIPIDEVMPIVDQMSAGETPTHARLGIEVGNPSEGDPAGAPIVKVTSGSTADKGGLTSGDVITAVDDQRISDADSLVATIRSYRPSDTVHVTWLRDGNEQTGDFVLSSDAD